MGVPIIVSAAADRDLELIYDYISMDSPSRAELVLNRLRSRIAQLSVASKACPVAPESEAFSVEVRSCLVGPYRVLYHPSKTAINVLCIRHGARRGVRSPNED